MSEEPTAVEEEGDGSGCCACGCIVILVLPWLIAFAGFLLTAWFGEWHKVLHP